MTAGVSKGHSDKYEPSSMASGASPDHGHLVAIMTGNTVPDLNTDQSFRRAEDPDLVLGCRKGLSIT